MKRSKSWRSPSHVPTISRGKNGPLDSSPFCQAKPEANLQIVQLILPILMLILSICVGFRATGNWEPAPQEFAAHYSAAPAVECRWDSPGTVSRCFKSPHLEFWIVLNFKTWFAISICNFNYTVLSIPGCSFSNFKTHNFQGSALQNVPSDHRFAKRPGPSGLSRKLGVQVQDLFDGLLLGHGIPNAHDLYDSDGSKQSLLKLRFTSTGTFTASHQHLTASLSKAFTKLYHQHYHSLLRRSSGNCNFDLLHRQVTFCFQFAWRP